MKKTVLGTLNFVLLLGIALLIHQVAFRPARGLEERFREDHEFIRGDSNDDGGLDISDAVHILGFLFLATGEPPCMAAADADDGGVIEISDAILVLHFLFRDAAPPAPPYPDRGADPTPDLGCREPPIPPLPPVGSLGGPDVELDADEAISWRRGRRLFDGRVTVGKGLGPFFNGDSCRGCHLDPVVGGAGGRDVDVVRFALRHEDGTVTPLEGGPAASRLSIPGFERDEVHPDANVVESRQTPTLLGLGLLDRLPEAVILANADPDDGDGDGISGRARMVGGRVGRFGHKAGVPSLRDFTADALFNEIGVTVGAALSDFAVSTDADDAPDPELPETDFEDLAFFVSHLAPAPRRIPDDPALASRIEEGEALFRDLGCVACHVPALEGPDGPVELYTDVLLHDVADPDRFQVDEPGVEPREFRTAPLRGCSETPPYLHDGSAESLGDAILDGHHGEAKAARDAYQALPFVDKLKLLDFLDSL